MPSSAAETGTPPATLPPSGSRAQPPDAAPIAGASYTVPSPDARCSQASRAPLRTRRRDDFSATDLPREHEVFFAVAKGIGVVDDRLVATVEAVNTQSGGDSAP